MMIQLYNNYDSNQYYIASLVWNCCMCISYCEFLNPYSARLKPFWFPLRFGSSQSRSYVYRR